MDNDNRIKLTLDTNCIINALCRYSNSPIHVEELEEILDLSDDEKLKIKVEVAITTSVEQDLDRDGHDARRNAIMDQLREFQVIGSLEPGGLEAAEDEVRRILFPGKKVLKENDRQDVRHVAIHKLHRQDFFVTSDKGDLLRKASALGEGLGVKVQNPPDCLGLVKQLVYRDKLSREETNSKLYTNPAFSGIAKFNYSNNNGVFTIGSGVFSFNTNWSKGSNRSIYCCKDATNLAGVAIADDVRQIDEINQASKYDFSSRVRSANLDNGKNVVVVKNQNGLYAGIQIKHIQDDTRGHKNDLLEFDYVVQTNGSDNFSS